MDGILRGGLTLRSAALAIAALVAIIALSAVFIIFRPFDRLSETAPPVEALSVERVQLDNDGITLQLRAGGSEGMRIAQVQVDGAYWQFHLQPDGPIGYLAQAALHIPYPWIAGETHHITIVSASGATFDHTIDVALPTTTSGNGNMAMLIAVGLMVGFVPIILGYGFSPLLSGGSKRRDFALALTVGLLLFLLIDTLQESMEAADQAAAGLHAPVLVWLVAILSFLILLATGRWQGSAPEGTRLALFIAIGIGLHNLGEGLAIGASFASGEVALASFLILGFALHNVSEGIAIAAPVKARALGPLLALAALAGLPAVPGTLLGAIAYAPLWVALAFAIGAGAIMQVIVEVSAYLRRGAQTRKDAFQPMASLAGLASGMMLMYLTGLLVRG